MPIDDGGNRDRQQGEAANSYEMQRRQREDELAKGWRGSRGRFDDPWEPLTRSSPSESPECRDVVFWMVWMVVGVFGLLLMVVLVISVVTPRVTGPVGQGGAKPGTRSSR